MFNKTVVVQTTLTDLRQASPRQLQSLDCCQVVQVSGFPQLSAAQTPEFIADLKSIITSYDIKLAIEVKHEALLFNLIGCLTEIDFIVADVTQISIKRCAELVPKSQLILTRQCLLDSTMPIEHRLATLVEWVNHDKQVDAALYCFTADDGLALMRFLHYLGSGSSNVVAYHEAEGGLWTRLLSLYLGASWLLCDMTAQANTSFEWLTNHYHLARLPARVTRLYGIIGDSIYKSFSPMVHNCALQNLHFEALYLPFDIKQVSQLESLFETLEIVRVPLLGLTVTAPFKADVALGYDHARPLISEVASANVLTRLNEKWFAQSTDDMGLLAELECQGIAVNLLNVAVLGSGSSGRVAASALISLGANVALFNRGETNARLAKKLLGIDCKPLSSVDLSQFDLVVNTIPFDATGSLPFDFHRIRASCRYIDYVYRPYPNALLAKIKSRCDYICDGFAILQHQLVAQFRCLTGQSLPEEARRLLAVQLSSIQNKKS